MLAAKVGEWLACGQSNHCEWPSIAHVTKSTSSTLTEFFQMIVLHAVSESELWSPFNEQNRGKYHSSKKVELGRFSAWKHSCIFIIWFYRGSIWAFSNSHRPQWKMIKRSSLGVWKQSCSELWSFGQPETHNAASVLWSEQHTTKYWEAKQCW